MPALVFAQTIRIRWGWANRHRSQVHHSQAPPKSMKVPKIPPLQRQGENGVAVHALR